MALNNNNNQNQQGEQQKESNKTIEDYNIPDSVISELQEKFYNQLIRHRIINPNHSIVTLDYIKKHTSVNHRTYQVTFFLKESLNEMLVNNIVINFKKPQELIDLENKLRKEQKQQNNNTVLVDGIITTKDGQTHNIKNSEIVKVNK